MVTRSNPAFTPEHLRFMEYLRAVGTGPKGNRHLSGDEAKDAFALILERRIPDTLISAFLLGWRVQGEQIEELQGCVEYLAQRLAAHRGEGVEIGYPMDGKTKFPFLMLKAAERLKEVSVHATIDVPLGPKYGVTADQCGFRAPNIILHRRSDLLKELSKLSDLRNAIGIRTAFNTLEKLNFLAPAALIGMHHAPYFDLYSSLYAGRYRRLLIVQGQEGTPEILKNTKYKIVENGDITTHHLNPEAFGIEPIAAKEEMSLSQMKALLERPDENLAKMITLNAAFLGFAAGKYENIEKGWECLQG